ncbi:MAG: HNH endonuclease [Acidimicrobiia bacterium]|nr:HNH endonuclease [Acidimicrobiia bacterium]
MQSEPYTLAEIAGRDGWRCHICQGAVPERLLGKAGYHPKGPSIDHLVPLALGGDDIRANVALAHHRCNSLKGATLPVAGVQLQLLAA